MNQDVDTARLTMTLKDLVACQHTLAAALEALIASHPEPARLRDAFQAALAIAPQVIAPPATVLENNEAIERALRRGFVTARNGTKA